MFEKATPRPWFAVNDGSDAEPMWSVKAARIAGRPPRHEVALCATGDSPQAMETDNARLIVTAVNEFDALVEALERLTKWVDDEDDNREGNLIGAEPSCNECTQGCTPLNFDKGPCAYHQARAVLARIRESSK